MTVVVIEWKQRAQKARRNEEIKKKQTKRKQKNPFSFEKLMDTLLPTSLFPSDSTIQFLGVVTLIAKE